MFIIFCHMVHNDFFWLDLLILVATSSFTISFLLLVLFLLYWLWWDKFCKISCFISFIVRVCLAFVICYFFLFAFCLSFFANNLTFIIYEIS